MVRLKVLSIKEPYASLLKDNIKHIETRSWKTNYRGEIYIHASKGIDNDYLKKDGLDKYVNSATAQVYKETEEMITSNVVSQVVERSIEGIAWEDGFNELVEEGEVENVYSEN